LLQRPAALRADLGADGMPAPVGVGAGDTARSGRRVVVFAAVGMVCVLVYGFGGSPALAAAAFGVVGIGGCVSMLAGPRLHRTAPDRPWRLIVSASALFLVGALVRPWAADQHGLTMAVADAFTLPGYGLLVGGIAALLRARNAIDRHALLDGLVICIGAGLVSMTAFALPAVRISDRPALVSALAGVYPLLDVALLLLLVNLAFTTAVRQPSFRLLAAGVGLLLAGDLGYAVIGARGQLSGPAWLDLPFLGCYVLFGCAALHPSMVELGRAVPRPVQAWSWRRLVLLLPALAAPSVLIILGPRSDAERIAVGVGSAAMITLLLVRAATAVTAYAQAQEVFRYQALHDGLTGLPNRVAVTNAVEHLIAAQRPESPPAWLFFLDLDGFKLVNDSWGHDAGDRLLVEVGRRLRAATPSGGALGRLGGDEFVVAAAAWPEEAAAIGERLMLTLTEPLQVGGAEIMVSASLGMAQWDGAGTADALMRDADTAMYRAKIEGRRRRVVFDPSMRREVRERVELEQALQRVLARGELRMAYQPIVRLSDGAVVGAEALMRWDHPSRGPIPPSTFIPIAEEAGLIADLGDWALRQALSAAADWRRAGLVGPDFWMSVNASPRQLRDDRVLRTVQEVLAATGLPATALVLEITESVMLDESAATELILAQLRSLGVRLVVDDFGTGFSALGYLRRHPVTGVKIDRAFVDGLGRDAEDEEIVRAVVAMSSALGLSIVAEGVETVVQRNMLAAMGVSLGQGWLWAKAATPEVFTERHGVGAPAPAGPVASAPPMRSAPPAEGGGPVA
jgi:diguanylate cyclase